MNETIKIKSDIVLKGLLLGKYPDILIEMCFEVIKYIRAFGIVPVLSSTFREGSAGVHGVFRGIDFRTWQLTMSQINDILNKINSKYQYDGNRPNMAVLIYHDTGRGPHLHLQSHPNTIKLNGDSNGTLSGRGVLGGEGSKS